MPIILEPFLSELPIGTTSNFFIRIREPTLKKIKSEIGKWIHIFKKITSDGLPCSTLSGLLEDLNRRPVSTIRFIETTSN